MLIKFSIQLSFNGSLMWTLSLIKIKHNINIHTCPQTAVYPCYKIRASSKGINGAPM